MEGIRFVTDEKGEKRESFNAVEKRLVKAGKLRA